MLAQGRHTWPRRGSLQTDLSGSTRSGALRTTVTLGRPSASHSCSVEVPCVATRPDMPGRPAHVAGRWPSVPARRVRRRLRWTTTRGSAPSPDRMSVWLGGRKDGFVIPLCCPLPKDAEVRSLRLVEKRRGRMGIRNRKLSSVEYEAHFSVLYPETAPVPSPESFLGRCGSESQERLDYFGRSHISERWAPFV